MSKERDILKSLLLKEELEVLDQLKSKFLSEEQFTDEVARVLSNAIKRSQKKDSQLERSLEKPIKKGVLRAFSESKQSIIDALLPVMGQLIRKTVANSIKQFVSDINRAIELGFSTKSIKWRWQARKAGVTYPEWIFHKTIRYQVQDILLINKQSGLLVEYVGSGDLLKDNNALSAMLTAIQSFIEDSFGLEDASLQSVEVKNQNLIIATGPKVYLAAVVKGNPTERLKQKFQEIIENIHAGYSEVLLQEETYQNNLELNDYLRSKLITKTLTDEQKETNTLPWIIALTLFLSALFYWSYTKKNALAKVTEKSRKIDGFYLQKVERTGSGYKVYGLLDPLSDTAVFSGEDVTFVTKPYTSLDEAIVQKRINQVTSDYNNIKTDLKEGHLVLSGKVMLAEIQLLLSRLYAVNGVDKIDNKLEIVSPPKVEKTEDLASLFDQVNSTYINIPDMENKANVQAQLDFVIKNLQLLQKKQIKIRLKIIGTSDCAGVTSDFYSLRRANLVKNILLELKIEPNSLLVDIEACDNKEQEKNPLKLGVSFKLKKQQEVINVSS